MRFLKLSCFFFAMIAGLTGAAQSSFLATYSFNTVSGNFAALKQTPDHGFITAGNYLHNGYWHVRVIKTDSSGNVQWSRKYGTQTHATTATSIELTPDGGYIFCGQLDSFNTGTTLGVTRLSSSGNVIWCRKYRSPGDSGALRIEASVIRLTNDHGFVLTGAALGSTYSMNVLKIDSAGQMQWIKRYCTGANKDRAYDIRQMADSGFVLCGKSTEYSNNTQEGAYVLRIDKNGNPLWGRGFGALQEYPLGLVISPDTSIVVTGFTQGMGLGMMDIFLFKLDFSGNLIWARTIGDAQNQMATAISLSPSGGYAITGNYSQPSGLPKLFFITTDTDGNLLHAKSYPQLPVSHGTHIIPTSGNGYAVGGNSYNIVSNTDKPLLLKTDSAGNLICGAEDIPFTGQAVTPQETQGFTVDSGGYAISLDPKYDSLAVMAPAFLCFSNAGFYVAATSFCAGTTPVHFANLHDSSTTAYWYINNILTDSTFDFDYTFSNAGMYTVTLISQPGNDTSSVQVTVNPLPAVSFLLPDTICFYTPSVYLPNYATPGGGFFYGGTVTTGDSAFYPSFAGPGNHTIYYSYTNFFGCTAIDSQTVFVKNCFVGISENGNTPQFSMYPNPAGEAVHLLFPDAADRCIAVYDLPGQLLYSTETQSRKAELSLPGLSTGLYFVTVTEAGSTSTQRLLLSR